MKKNILITATILVGIIIIGLIYLMFFNRALLDSLLNKSDKSPAKTENVKQTNTKTGSSAEQEVKKIKINNEEVNSTVKNQTLKPVQAVNKEDLKRLAASFTERFGSYSNQSNFSNINDLKIFMSEKMRDWATEYVEKEQQSPRNAIYYGITTKSVSQEVTEFDDDTGTASVVVGTRRREANGSTNNVSNIYNQNILINFVKESGIWKIDSANWQK